MTPDNSFLIISLTGFAVLLILTWGLQQIIANTKRTADACEAMAEAIKARNKS